MFHRQELYTSYFTVILYSVCVCKHVNINMYVYIYTYIYNMSELIENSLSPEGPFFANKVLFHKNCANPMFIFRGTQVGP